VLREDYLVGVPQPGYYQEILNTDSARYDGTNVGNLGGVHAEPVPWNDRPYSINLRLPPLAAVYLQFHHW
jgi:1,4-alpha-glucan branching enzyme